MELRQFSLKFLMNPFPLEPLGALCMTSGKRDFSMPYNIGCIIEVANGWLASLIFYGIVTKVSRNFKYSASIDILCLFFFIVVSSYYAWM
jgi:hypothetical protein